MRDYWRRLSHDVGPTGMKPVLILMAVAALERFANQAVSVLLPNIRDSFHISNGAALTAATISAVLPGLASPWAGYLSDRVDRIRYAQIATLVVGVVSVGLGLAPWFWLFVVLLLAAGFGLLVNFPTHSSLITDYYPPRALGTTFTFYLLATTAIGVIDGPIAGGLAQGGGWGGGVWVCVSRWCLVVLLFVGLGWVGVRSPPPRGVGVFLRAGDRARG